MELFRGNNFEMLPIMFFPVTKHSERPANILEKHEWSQEMSSTGTGVSPITSMEKTCTRATVTQAAIPWVLGSMRGCGEHAAPHPLPHIKQGRTHCASHHILFLPMGSIPCRQQLMCPEQSPQAHPRWHQPISSLYLHVQFHSFQGRSFPVSLSHPISWPLLPAALFQHSARLEGHSWTSLGEKPESSGKSCRVSTGLGFQGAAVFNEWGHPLHFSGSSHPIPKVSSAGSNGTRGTSSLWEHLFSKPRATAQSCPFSFPSCS